MDNIATIISLSIGLISFLGGAVAYYRGSVRKGYAAEREFNHIRRNQESVSQLLTHIDDCIDRRFDHVNEQLVEIKGKLDVLLHQRPGA